MHHNNVDICVLGVSLLEILGVERARSWPAEGACMFRLFGCHMQHTGGDKPEKICRSSLSAAICKCTKEDCACHALIKTKKLFVVESEAPQPITLTRLTKAENSE